MQTEALQLAARGEPERLAWGPVALQVTDLDRSAFFWTRALGLQVRVLPEGLALGTSTETLVTLHPGARRPVEPRAAGLYHVALGMPDKASFSRILARLLKLELPISPVDHTMSKAVYLNDPDGFGIEVAHETPERFGRFAKGPGFGLYEATGQLRSGREPLDLARELQAVTSDPMAPLEGAFVAHLHLQVPALEPALDWYARLGFARNLHLPQMGFADMGAGAAYTHRLAMNVWAGPGIAPPRPDSARLLTMTLRGGAPQSLTDPTGATLRLIPMED